MDGSASSNAIPSGVQGVCPLGWHLPSISECIELTNYLNETTAGGKLKETGTTHWNSPNTGATNEIGFTALPGGYRTEFNTFEEIGNSGLWWCSYDYDTFFAFFQVIHYNSSKSARSIYHKQSGFSVRCVKDE